MKSSLTLVLLTVISPLLGSCEKEYIRGKQTDPTQRNIPAKVVRPVEYCSDRPVMLKLLSQIPQQFAPYDFKVYASKLPDSLNVEGLEIMIDYVAVYQDQDLNSYCGQLPLNQVIIFDAVRK